MYLHVQSSDIIKLILQFFKEQNLDNSFKALSEESGVEFNAVTDLRKLENDLLNGKWNSVIETLKTIKCPKEKLIELYEQILVELAELGDVETSVTIVKLSKTINVLKKYFPEKISKLQRALSKYPFDTLEYYSNSQEKLKRRKNIAESVLEEVYAVQSSRLLTLLNQALKWQQNIGCLPKGSKLDLLRGTVMTEKSQREKVISKLDNEINLEENNTHINCAAFSYDGQLLATGTNDGFVEIWDFETAKLKKDLKYQAEDEFIIHSYAITSLCFSKDSEKLAIGGKDGQIKIFSLNDGECLKYFKDAHEKSIVSIEFSKDGLEILSGSLDQTAKIHGLKSNKTIKTFIGHKSFVNSAKYISSKQIITSSSDGTLKIWNRNNSSCEKTIEPFSENNSFSITSLKKLPNKNHFFVCSNSPSIILINLKGEQIKSFSIPKRKNVSENIGMSENMFVCCTVSYFGKYLYCLDENSLFYCFSVENGNLLNVVKAHEKPVLGIVHHPHINLIASYCNRGTMRLWRSNK